MDKQKNIRSGWLALTLATLAMSMIACGPATQPAPQAPAETQEKPQYGGTFVFAGLSSPAHLDVLVGAGTGDNRNSGGIYDKLLEYDYIDPDYEANYNLVSSLAERWEITPDGKSYTLFLRKDVKWHDGEPFTGADVVYTFQRIINEKGSLSSKLTDVERMEALDTYTVKLTSRVADASFLLGLGANNMGIQPKHVSDRGMDLKKTAIGTGPFKLESFDPKSKSVWVKNPNFWQQGLPYMDRVDLIWGLDKPGMMAAFAALKVDNTYIIDQVAKDTIQKVNPNAQLIKFYWPGTSLMINTKHPILQDLRVRRAIHLATDRQEQIKINAAGDGVLGCYLTGAKTGWCLPGLEQMPGFRQPKDQDIAEAKRLLAEAGYAKGFEFNVLWSAAYTQLPPLVEVFATQMERIGVKAVLDGRDTPTYNDLQRKGIFDAIALSSAPWGATLEKSSVHQYYHTKGVLNKHGYGNAELDRLIDQQAVTFDPEERKKLWQQMQHIMLDNLWNITFTGNAQYGMVQPWVKGPMTLSAGHWQTWPSPRIATTWLDQKMLPQR